MIVLAFSLSSTLTTSATVSHLINARCTYAILACLTYSRHLLCNRFNQAGPMGPSLLLSSSMLIALVPMSAGLLIPLTCFHCETIFVSKISATRLATITCCLRWELCIHGCTIVESVQKLQQCNFMQSRLSVLFVGILDRPPRKSCLQMRRQTHEVQFVSRCIEASAINACFSYNWQFFLPPQELSFFRLHFVVPMLTILSPDVF